MLGFLEDIWNIVENLPTYIEIAAIGVVNVIMTAIEGLLLAAALLLPGLPEVIEPPEFVGELNWFYPIGPLLAVAAPLLAGYVVWLAVGWIYRKYGEL